MKTRRITIFYGKDTKLKIIIEYNTGEIDKAITLSHDLNHYLDIQEWKNTPITIKRKNKT